MSEDVKETKEPTSVVPMETAVNRPREDTDKKQSICSSWRDISYRRKFIYTVYLTIGFAMLGFMSGQRGPTFLDLQIITDTDLEQASAFFTSGGVGYLLGSLASGVVYDRCNKVLVMFLSVLFSGIVTGIIPFCSPYGLMIFVHFVGGVMGGGIDTCGNAELVRVWGSEGRSAMQSAHFLFAVGGVISPLVTKPFLAPIPQNTTFVEDVLLDGHVNNLPMNLTIQSFTNSSNATRFDEEKPTTIVFYAYLIAAFLTILTSVPFLITFFKEISYTKTRTPRETTDQGRDLPLSVYLFTLVLICLTFFLYCSVEDTFAAFLVTFMVKGQGWTKSRSTELTATFWASFAGGRLCGIFVVKWISTVKLMFLCSLLMIVSMFGFLASAHYFTRAGIWICSVGAGLSMSVFFPAGLSWIEDELMKLSGKVSSAVIIAATLGAMVSPILLAFLIEGVSPMWFTYILAAESVLCLLILFILFIFARTHLKKIRQKTSYEVEMNISKNVANVDHKLM